MSTATIPAAELVVGDVITAPGCGPDAAVTRVHLEAGRVYLAARVVDAAARAGEPWAENADDEWDADAGELVTVVRSGESGSDLLRASRQPLACVVSLPQGERGRGDRTMTRYSTRDEADRIVDIRRYIVEHPQRSAWGRGVDLYALELLDSLTEQGETEYHGSPADHKALLNGADDWPQYSEGGCALIYDADICERLCSPSEQKRRDGGRLEPNRDESWIDVQARALYQAELRIRAARAEVE